MASTANNYRDLDIYKISYRLALEVHKLTLELPKYELYEQGSQVRRSSKSIKSAIVEGYGRRRYKQDFVKFLIYAQSSCDETIDHLQMISEIHFPKAPLSELINKYNVLGKKIYRYTQYVESNWETQ